MSMARETVPAQADARPWPGVREWQRQKRRPAGAAHAFGFWGGIWAQPGGKAGLVILAALLSIAAFAGILYPGDPLRTVGEPLLWPGIDPRFPLGTDSLGRDVAAGLAYGARTSLAVGAAAAFISTLVGILLGAMAGYFGGWVDVVVLRVTELFQATPMFLLVVVIVALFQPSEVLIALAIGFTTWETIARLVRAEFRQLLHSDFVLAARSQGMGSARIIFSEVLPNVLPSIVVMISFKVVTAIFIETSLAFLGLSDPGAVSWGAMIGDGRDFIRSAWYLTVAPTIAIVLTVLSLNLLGDALTEVLNPRLRRLEE